MICQLSHNIFMAHKSGHMNRRESRLPETQKYAALRCWELHARANITSFQNTRCFSKQEDLILSLSSNGRLLCMEARFELRLKIV